MLKCLTEEVSVRRGCLPHIVGIFLFGHILVLEHFAVYEQFVLRHGESDPLYSLTACGHIPEVILFHTGSRVQGVGMYTDMFGCVIAETLDPKAQ